jgi:hypothetical protein
MRLRLALLLLIAGTAFAQSGNLGTPATIRVPTEPEELARGYAEAYAAIRNTPVFLVHSRDDTTTVLVGVRSVRAMGGVLVVQDEKGLTYALNPRDVVMITDAPPKREH